MAINFDLWDEMFDDFGEAKALTIAGKEYDIVRAGPAEEGRVLTPAGTRTMLAQSVDVKVSHFPPGEPRLQSLATLDDRQFRIETKQTSSSRELCRLQLVDEFEF